MVEKMRLIFQEIEKKRGPLTLFVLMREDDFMHNWSLFLCGDHLSNTSEDFRYVVDTINHHLTPEEANLISRTSILPKDDHLVELFSRYRPDQKIKDTHINGFMVQEAYILASRG